MSKSQRSLWNNLWVRKACWGKNLKGFKNKNRGKNNDNDKDKDYQDPELVKGISNF